MRPEDECKCGNSDYTRALEYSNPAIPYVGAVNLVRDTIDMRIVFSVVSVFTMHEFFFLFVAQRPRPGDKRVLIEGTSCERGYCRLVVMGKQGSNNAGISHTKFLVIVSRETRNSFDQSMNG